MNHIYQKAEDIIREAEKKIKDLPLTKDEQNDIIYFLAIIKLSVIPRLNRKYESEKVRE